MVKLILVGSGTPDYTPKRWGTSFLMELDGEWVMIDCGPASVHKMYQVGVAPTKINHLFFSHFHSDHVADYPCFLMMRFDQSIGTEADLQVYGPPPISMMTQKIWSPEGAFWCDAVARVEHPKSQAVYQERGGVGKRPFPTPHVHEVQPNQVIETANWRCTVYEVQHAQPYLTCYGFRFETAVGVIAFSGDADPTDTLLPLAQDADLLVMAAMGFVDSKQRQRGAAIAKKAGVKRLVVTHQSPELTAVADQALHDIQAVYGGPIHWGKDLMEITW